VQDSEFAASVRKQDGVAIIDLKGDVDGFAEQGMNAAYADAVRDGPTTVLVNFREVGYINSTGIALIVGMLAQARKSRLHLLACGLSDHYQEIFHITRLADFMHIFPDETSALAAGPAHEA
jgi:anti-anti-sigma factor